jgi:hypothetical protein
MGADTKTDWPTDCRNFDFDSFLGPTAIVVTFFFYFVKDDISIT